MAKINREEYEVLKELDDKWKWIARDRDRLLFVFNVKPRKGINYEVWDVAGWDDDDYLEIEDSDLFQFIQWEDEEPCSIAELIEEYEQSLVEQIYEDEKETFEKLAESEETEAKKDIDWLKEQVKVEEMEE